MKEEIYDKLPKHREDTDVGDYSLKLTGISLTVVENLFIDIEETTEE